MLRAVERKVSRLVVSLSSGEVYLIGLPWVALCRPSNE